MLAVAVRGAQTENFSNGRSKCMVYDEGMPGPLGRNECSPLLHVGS